MNIVRVRQLASHFDGHPASYAVAVFFGLLREIIVPIVTKDWSLDEINEWLEDEVK